MRKLLLFDIDGTLVLTERGSSYRILRHIFSQCFDIEIGEEHIPHLSGKTDHQIVEETLGKCGIERYDVLHYPAVETALLEATRRSIRAENTRVLPGVVELLPLLESDYYLSLVTGNIRSTAQHKLEVSGIVSWFAEGAFGCDSKDRKVLPRLAKERAEVLWSQEFNPQDCVIIGDSPFDVDCAKANAMPCIGVATGHFSTSQLLEAGADFVLPDLSDPSALLDILAQL